MAKIRSVRREILKNEDVSAGGLIPKLLYIGLVISLADDEGRFKAIPELLKSEIFPLDDVSAAQAAEALHDLSLLGLAQLYESDGKKFGWLPAWGGPNGQRIPESRFEASKLPPPPAHTRRKHGANTTQARRKHVSASCEADVTHEASEAQTNVTSRAGAHSPSNSSSSSPSGEGDEGVEKPREAPLAEVRELHAMWIASTKRDPHRTALTPERIRLWRQARKLYPQRDVIDAARGISLDPFFMGQNDRHRPYDEVKHVTKPDNLERFRDLERGVKRTVVAISPEDAERRAQQDAWLRRGEIHEEVPA